MKNPYAIAFSIMGAIALLATFIAVITNLFVSLLGESWGLVASLSFFFGLIGVGLAELFRRA